MEDDMKLQGGYVIGLEIHRLTGMHFLLFSITGPCKIC